MLAEPGAEGVTDDLAAISRFAMDGVIGEVDAVHSSGATDAPEGFGEDHLAWQRRLGPFPAHAVKAATLARVARTLVETDRGRDTGRRVLAGLIARGRAHRIEAVLWSPDLRGFTRSSDAAPERVIPLLNDDADAIVSAVHEAGGDVLEFIGDGALAAE